MRKQETICFCLFCVFFTFESIDCDFLKSLSCENKIDCICWKKRYSGMSYVLVNSISMCVECVMSTSILENGSMSTQMQILIQYESIRYAWYIPLDLAWQNCLRRSTMGGALLNITFFGKKISFILNFQFFLIYLTVIFTRFVVQPGWNWHLMK